MERILERAERFLKDFDKLNLHGSIEDIFSAKIEDRPALCGEFVTAHWWAAECLLKEFNDLEINQCSVEQRMKLFLVISKAAPKALMDNFDLLGIKDLPLEDRLRLCNELIEKAPGICATNIAKFRLEEVEPEIRLRLCSDLARLAAKEFVQNLDEFIPLAGSIEEIRNICLNKEATYHSMKDNLQKLQFDKESFQTEFNFALCILNKIQRNNKFKERYSSTYREGYYSSLYDKTPFDYRYEHLKKKVHDYVERSSSFSDCLNRCKDLATGGSDIADYLRKNFNAVFQKHRYKLELDDKSLEERECICRETIAAGAWAAHWVLDNWRYFKLEENKGETRLVLYREILAKYPQKAVFLARACYLNSQEVSAKDRLTFYYEILTTSQSTTLGLESFFKENKDALLGITSKELRDLFIIMKSRYLYSTEDFIHIFWHLASGYLTETTITMESYLWIKCFSSIQIKNSDLICSSPLVIRQLMLQKINFSYDDNIISIAFSGDLRSLSNILCKNKEQSISSEEVEAFRKLIAKHEKLHSINVLMDRILAYEEPLRSSLLDWAAYTAGILYDLNDKNIESIKRLGIIETIFNLRNPLNRYKYSRLLTLMTINHSEFLAKTEGLKHSWTGLAKLLMAPLIEHNDLAPEKAKGFIQEVDKVKGFKDPKRFNSMAELFFAVIEQQFSKEETDLCMDTALEVIQKIREKKTKRNEKPLRGIVQISVAFDAFANNLKIFGKEALITCMRSKNDPREYFIQNFKALFELQDLDHVEEMYSKTFGTFRDQMAIFSYKQSIKNQDVEVKKGLTHYVRCVLLETFQTERYRTEQSESSTNCI